MDHDYYMEQLRRCLALLSDEDRTVLILHYFCGFSTAQIARLLNITRSAVLVRLHRARERMRRLLEEEDQCFAA